MHTTSAARPGSFNRLPALLSQLTARSAGVTGKKTTTTTGAKVMKRKFVAKFCHPDLPHGRSCLHHAAATRKILRFSRSTYSVPPATRVLFSTSQVLLAAARPDNMSYQLSQLGATP
ncbi:uncharacterized protein LOC116800900 [Drosophila sechellia]|uniref:uncharacterized protein LOC116800900 n=1 Tax=Drosophila sechellia TaxID=7238 RepID=UPI0013DDF58B|nr:uncharacterized protein LOC116800900 [Drosophila sechellia]